MSSKNGQHYVYRYIHNGEIVYIGRCDGRPLWKRIDEHKNELKFRDYCGSVGMKYEDFNIEYIQLPNFVEEKIAETILINKHKPVLNSADKVCSEYSCIDAKVTQEWARIQYPNPKKQKVARVKIPECKSKKELKSTTEQSKLLRLFDNMRELQSSIYALENSKDDSSYIIPSSLILKDKEGYPLFKTSLNYETSRRYGGVPVASWVSTEEVGLFFPVGELKKIIPLFKIQHDFDRIEALKYGGYSENYRGHKNVFVVDFFEKKKLGELRKIPFMNPYISDIPRVLRRETAKNIFDVRCLRFPRHNGYGHEYEFFDPEGEEIIFKDGIY